MSYVKKCVNIFSEKGRISQISETFEHRNEQIEMVKGIASAIKNDKNVLVEAGTGIGKTFAYLAPSLLWIKENGGNVIVSTRTLNLQDQIFFKDVPIIDKVLNEKIACELVKGKANYLCKRRFHTFMSEMLTMLNDKITDEMQQITQWVNSTNDGSLSTLGFKPSPNIWQNISVDAGCSRKKCNYAHNCFFIKARKRADQAELIVTNHHLIFSAEPFTDKCIFPKPTIWIFDEAHSLPDIARKQLGLSLSKYEIYKLLSKFDNKRNKIGYYKLINNRQVLSLVRQTKKEFELFFKYIIDWKKNTNGAITKPLEFEVSPEITLDKLIYKIEMFQKENGELIPDGILAEIKGTVTKMNAFSKGFKFVMKREGGDDFVYWVEQNSMFDIRLFAVPLNVAKILKDKFFNEQTKIIMTSATLTTGNYKSPNFDFFVDKTGFEDSIKIQIGSPFDYKNNATLYVAKDIPKPGNLPEFIKKSKDIIIKFVKQYNGKTLILCTSYKMMNELEKELAEDVQAIGVNLITQSHKLSRHQIIEKFKQKNAKMVIIGVDSFWHGIDIPGDPLKNLIIAQLPFPVPSEPIHEAEGKRLREKGRNSFFNLSLPIAIIKFKQGFGRIIRTKTDTGNIIVLDKRIVTERYGRKFIEALPDINKGIL